ncbi:MAG: hypothetical protein WCR36_06815 [Bacteroidaceae bacterium]
MNRGPRLIEHLVKSKALFPIALVFSISAWALAPYNWVVALIYGVITFFLWVFERHFTLFQIKSQLHLTFFVLLSILVPSLHTNVGGSLIMVLFIISIYLLFDSYQQRDAVLTLHLIGILGGIGSLIDPRTTVFMFTIWFIAYQVQAIKIRGLIASLLGMGLPLLLWVSYLLVNNQIAQFSNFICQYKSLYIPQIGTLQWDEWTILGLISILVISATVHILSHTHYDKLRTATYISLISAISVFLIILNFLFVNWWAIVMPSLFGISSLLFGHYFSSQKGKFTGIILVIIFLFMGAMGIYEMMKLK